MLLIGYITYNVNSITEPSIHACRNVNRDIIALEEDKAIFMALLAPLVQAPKAHLFSQPTITTTIDDIDDGDVVVQRIVKKSWFNKFILLYFLAM